MKHQNTIMLQQKHYGDGHLIETLNISKQNEDTDDTNVLTTNLIQNVSDISMHECPHINNDMTLLDKSIIVNNDIQHIELLKISDQVLTTIEKDLKPFWNEQSNNLSAKLWLPQKIDCPDLVTTSLNSYVTYTIPNLQSSTITTNTLIPSQRILSQSSPIIPQNITAPESINNIIYTTKNNNNEIETKDKNEDITYARKIRFYPSKQQLSLFNKCFGCTRYLYNKCITFTNTTYKARKIQINEECKLGCIYRNKKDIQCKKKLCNQYFCKKHEEQPIKWGIPLSIAGMRPLIMSNDEDLKPSELWQKEIPYDTRQNAIKHFIGDLEGNITRLHKGQINHFNFKYKTKKDNKQYFYIDKRAIKKGLNIFVTRLGKHSTLKTHKRYKNAYKTFTPEHNCIITKENNIYYLIISKTKQQINKDYKHDNIALDLGVRTFATFYSDDNIIGEIGKNLLTKYNKLHKRVDKLTSIKDTLNVKTKKMKNKHNKRSEWSDEKRELRNKKRRHNKKKKKKIKHTSSRKKYNISLKCSLLRTKIKNGIKDIQWKICNFLVRNFKNIIVGDITVSNMILKSTRNITNQTARNIQTLSFYKFKEKLKYKCNEYKRNLIIINEAYTSKTCTKCGNIKRDLGSNKTYKCTNCNLIIDRDINAARNIFIKSHQ